MGKRGSRGGRKKQAAKAKSQATQAAQAVKVDAGGAQAAPAVANYSSGGGYDGAGTSPRRGRIIWPTLDTKKETTPRTRKEITKRARWSDANIGLAKRALDAPTNLIGFLTPQADTGFEDWDKEADEVLERRFENPLAFDRAGKLDFAGWQEVITRTSLRDSDNVTALLKTKSTGGGQVAFYEAHQIDNGRDNSLPDNLNDGVFSDAMGRALGYRLVNASDPTKFATLPARAAVFHCNSMLAGKGRGVSAVAHAISNITDIVEILADTKHGIKIAAQWGVALETAPGAGAGGGGMSDELKEFLGNGDNKSDDAEVDDGLNLDAILQGGRMQATPEGSKITTIQDDRPHPNQLNLLRWLVRDIAWGLGLAPEVLWEMAGLNGTATRYLMADTRRWVLGKQRILQRSCQRVRTFFLNAEILAGRVSPPPVDRWWKCKWIPQADPTIDQGRVGKLELDQLDKGATNYQEIYARRGLNYEDAFKQEAKEKKMRKRMGLDD